MRGVGGGGERERDRNRSEVNVVRHVERNITDSCRRWAYVDVHRDLDEDKRFRF